jgi:molecular chaperone Hsp33
MNVRGLAKWKGDDPRGTLGELTGNGRLAITVETGKGSDRYQGIVAADADSLATALENYFARSEQLPTRLWLAADDCHAGGMLLQQLPPESRRGLFDPDGWNRAQLLAGTLSSDELLGLGDIELLRRLFHEEDVRLADATPVTFRCSCDRKRVESALRLLGRGELEDLLEGEGRIEVRCEFCNKAYELDAVDVERLLADQGMAPPAPSDRLH